jgi:hypothetical protein
VVRIAWPLCLRSTRLGRSFLLNIRRSLVAATACNQENAGGDEPAPDCGNWKKSWRLHAELKPHVSFSLARKASAWLHRSWGHLPKIGQTMQRRTPPLQNGASGESPTACTLALQHGKNWRNARPTHLLQLRQAKKT